MRRSAQAVVVALSLLVWSSAVDVEQATATSAPVSAKALLARLVTAPEAGSGTYVRSRFAYPSDADHDCQDTRAEVLLQESSARAAFTSSKHCVVRSGRWSSYYDGAVATSAAALQVDHLVPLAQAWVSGARSWTAAQRTSYANDLAYGPTLVAVSSRQNLAKGDRDPARWLPPLTSARCVYATQWVQVKYRWGLTVDAAERAALARILTGACGARVVAVPARMISPAPVPLPTPSPTPTPTPTPTATPSPTPTPTTTPAPSPAAPTCSATMTDARPARYGRTTVVVATSAGATVTTTARYKTTSTSHSATADASGTARLEYSIGGATAGFRVVVDVAVSLAGASGHCQTAFTPA